MTIILHAILVVSFLALLATALAGCAHNDGAAQLWRLPGCVDFGGNCK